MMRTHKKIIKRMFAAIDTVKYIGVCIEPIAAVADKDDEIPGDYTMRVSIEFELEPEKLHVSVFTMAFHMIDFQAMDAARFDRNMQHIRRSLLKHVEDVRKQGAKGIVSRVDGDRDLGDIRDELIRKQRAH